MCCPDVGRLLLLSVTLALSTATRAADLVIPFAGVDRAHIAFDRTSSLPNTVGMRVLVSRGGEDRELATGTARVQGTARATGLTPGEWVARIEVTTRDPKATPPREEKFNIASLSFSVGTNLILGELRFDESFADLPGTAVSIDLNGHAWTATGGSIGTLQLRGSGRASVASTIIERELTVGLADLDLTQCTLRWTGWALEADGTPGTRGAVRLDRCEVHGGVRLRAPRPLSLLGNLFMGMVALDGSGWPGVTIQENTFYGSEGLVGGVTGGPRDTLSIGANYFSDPVGPNERTFGVRRAATLDTGMFKEVSRPTDRRASYATRRIPKDPALKTRIDLGGVRIGQNIATSDSSLTIHPGRETLVTVDLIPNKPRVTGAKVFARVGGTDYEPLAPPILYREYSDLPSGGGPGIFAAVQGGLTCNILLPPHLPVVTNAFGQRSSTVEVYLNTSNVVDHVVTNEPLRLLGTFTLYRQADILRPLRLLVVPVRFAVTNTSITTNSFAAITPDVVPTVTALREFGPAWWPLRREELHVEAGSEMVFGQQNTGWFDTSSVTYALLTLADYLQGRFEELNAAQTNAALRFDRLVAVLAEGLLGQGTEGFNANFSSAVAVIDEARPVAAIHELAHSFGINSLVEEYKLIGTSAYDQGYPMEGTAFVPETDLKVGVQPEYSGFPRLNHFGAAGTGAYVNIMGCRPTPWINRATWKSFQSAFAFLSQPVSPGAPALQDARAARLASSVESTPLPAGFRRILLSGLYSRSGTPWPFDREILNYTLLPGSMRAEDVTGVFPYVLRSGNSGKSDRFNVRMFDAAGKVVWDSPVPALLLEDPIPLAVATGSFVHTIDLPPATTQFRVEAADGVSPLLLSVDGSQPLNVRVISPVAGDTFDGTLPVAIESSRSNLVHRLWWRPTGVGDGAWSRLLGSPTGLRFELGPQFAERPGRVDLRIRSSDGYGYVENMVEGLDIPDRKPRVRLVSPEAGSTTGTRAVLCAVASDAEDGMLTGGSWRSSVQGFLGNGASLAATLTPGPHRLTYSVRDSGGHLTEASADVTVEGFADIGLDPGTLTINPAEWPGPSKVLLVGRTNRVTLRGSAAANVAEEIRLEVIDPDGASRDLGSLGSGVDESSFLLTSLLGVEREGRHRFRWTIATPRGPIVRERSVDAVTPGVRVVIEPPEAAAAGAQWRFNGGEFQASGAVLSPDALSAAERRITFKAVTGWLTAPTFHLPAERTGVYTVIGRYRPDTGFAPWFDTQPKGASVDLGRSASFSTWVNGKPAPTYQWFKDGQAIAGATRSGYSISKVTAADAGTYTLLASNINGGTFSQPAVLIVPGVVPADPFAAWAAGYPAIAGAAGPADDPDRDGLANLVEYALASDPGSPSSGPRTRADLVVEAGQQYLGFLYRRPKGVSARVQYGVTASRSIDAWEGLPTRLVQVVDRGAYEEVLVRTETAVATGAAGFIRLTLQYAPP